VDLLWRAMRGRTHIRQSRPDVRQSRPDIRQSGPDSGLVFQVEVPKLFHVVSRSALLLEKPKEFWVDLLRRTMLERTHIRQTRPDIRQSRPDTRQSTPDIR